ncbi:beta-galactosidase [Candidatus Halobonum tyrrellensis]|uniref:beta-galactosidase n=1 Tax=Candidatus Halobonum tyrrellensis G22 TaxID=1324957 RepID=V4HGW5_9EURY|nr:beta-galactosidase [Candidatus Halobonum tyrrellensis]ESP87074.1 beta-galactosidase [Candidatus Halobonum tyrrellensis G22]
MNVGVCYFPEHWPAERAEADVERMAEAGIEYVRMGEFAWSRFEPEPGEFEFDWLERAVDLVGEYGMQAVLCTPTAAPPKWLVDEHPDILQAEADGTTRQYGGRRHYCFNSPTYRRETRRIVGALAERFADHPAVAGWQTDNEYGCHGTLRCYCDDCASAFRGWLRETYGDVETLNGRWGTAFWSQELNSFAQADPPRHTAADHHPSRLLDYYRFCSDSAVEYNRIQTRLLREADDDWFVTHNFMSHYGELDAYDVCADLDFASWDSYPTGHVQERREHVSEAEYRAGNPDNLGLDHDLYRSATGEPFWVMEQQPGDINWPPYSPQPAAGAMRLWAQYAAAHGADVVSYFRWRRCLTGQEQYHAGLLERDGEPDAGYHDASDAAAEFDDIGGERDADDGESLAVPDADVALLHSYDDLWALGIEPMTPDFDYWLHVETYYAALRERSVGVDVVRPTADLSGYDAAVAPSLYLADDDLADALGSYVEGGGELLVGMRSGVKDPYNKLHDAPQPGPLATLVGATVDDHESVPDSLESGVVVDGERFDARVWNEWLSPADDGAEVVARYDGGRADGEAAVVRNAVGEGAATYVGTWPGEELARTLVGDVLDRAGVETTDPLPAGVRLANRGGLTWVANFSADPVPVDAPDGATWHVGDDAVDPYDVAVTDAAPSSLAFGDRPNDA